ncbi:tumor susceptibility 101 L homeolog [Xenopus laevis]|uniref:Tsg101-prov protein n=1 Tax=Xenopus laevis TaxID=8355 RepID=Q6DDX9_XENLA|nr:tumor susceptibility 101 L homeolog [Xenopus laevis]AAH77372.1 Tsg101-prov protein [Xenopus laevis]
MAVSEAQLKKMLGKYKYRDLSVREILNVTSLYRDLKPIMDSYVFNDGSSRELLSLSGTIPVPYKGNTYNIPICLWLLDTYPFNPPICFVKPTSTMTIKTGKHVDANGKIYLPYLHEWKHPPSDLLGLIQILIVVFGEEPPVFSRSTAPAPYPMYPATGPPNSLLGVSLLPPLVSDSLPMEEVGDPTEEESAIQTPIDMSPTEQEEPPSLQESPPTVMPDVSTETLIARLETLSKLHRHEYRSLQLCINGLLQEQRRQHLHTLSLINSSFSSLGDTIREGFQQLQSVPCAPNSPPANSSQQPPQVPAHPPHTDPGTESDDPGGFGVP